MGGHSAWRCLFSGNAVGREAVRGGKSPSARNRSNLMPLSLPAPSPWHRRRPCTRSGGLRHPITQGERERGTKKKKKRRQLLGVRVD
jgi:hypothetical protein